MNNDERKDKCVYVHKLDGVIVYVGSGHIRRIKDKSHRRKEHLDVWDYLQIEVVENNLTEKQCKVLEKELIENYWSSGKLFNKVKHSYETLNFDWEYFDSILYCDSSSKSGLRWKIQKGSKALKDAEAGNIFGKGYYQLCVDYVNYLCHRVVYCIANKTNIPSGMVVDHIDGDKSNNSPNNLRVVSQSVNSKNRKYKKSNTGLQSISEYHDKYKFKIHWHDNLKSFDEFFSYRPNPRIKSKNHYPTRDLALAAAINYRDSLVTQGLIELTGE